MTSEAPETDIDEKVEELEHRSRKEELRFLEDGCGCAEVWEELSEQRETTDSEPPSYQPQDFLKLASVGLFVLVIGVAILKLGDVTGAFDLMVPIAPADVTAPGDLSPKAQQVFRETVAAGSRIRMLTDVIWFAAVIGTGIGTLFLGLFLFAGGIISAGHEWYTS